MGELRSTTSTANSKPCSGKLRGRNRYAQSPTNCQIETQLVQNLVIEPFQAVIDLVCLPRACRPRISWANWSTMPFAGLAGVRAMPVFQERKINVSNWIYRIRHHGQAHVEKPHEGRPQHRGL